MQPAVIARSDILPPAATREGEEEETLTLASSSRKEKMGEEEGDHRCPGSNNRSNMKEEGDED